MNKRKDLISSDVRYLCLSKGKQTHVRLKSMILQLIMIQLGVKSSR